MYAIHKYPLDVTDIQWVPMPYGAEILCVQVQHGKPCLWAKVDVDQEIPVVKRPIVTVGTGHQFEGVGYRYIGTFQLEAGAFVGHVFEAT